MKLLALPVTCLMVVLSVGDRRQDAELSIELVDESTGKPMAGLVRVVDGDGKQVVLEGLLSRGQGLNRKAPIGRWSVAPGPVRARVPKGKLTIEAFHGLVTTVARREVDLTGKDQEKIRIGLRRFHDPADSGWRSANTHLHLRRITRAEAERYLREVPRADGLDVLFVSHLERAGDDRTYVSNGFTPDDLEKLSGSGVRLGYGEEHRHNFTGFGEGYGHVMFLNLKKLVHPVSIGPGIMKKGTDGIPLRRGIEEARRQDATVIWCHNMFGLEDVPSWLAGRVHAQNVFDGGTHGSYRDTFYRYLNAGLRVPFSTGTDWFMYDLSRVYVRSGDSRSPRDLTTALAAGKSYITNGPLLEFTVGGREIGDTLELPGPGRVRIAGRATGREDFRRIELILNGKPIRHAESEPAKGVFTARMDIEVEMSGPSWLALRTPPFNAKPAPVSNVYGRPIFSHTSPVYVRVAGRDHGLPAVMEELKEEVKRSRQTILEKARFASDGERNAVLQVYDDASK